VSAAPLFSIVVPSRGEPRRLYAWFAALARQSFPRDRWECIVVLDGVRADPGLAASAAAIGARLESLDARAGPGAARNLGADRARGEFLAFTEDDVTPEPDWLARAAARLDEDSLIDVLEGATLKPGGRSVHRRPAGRFYLPTNLFVRRVTFARLGGYDPGFFDPASGVYFREDSDFGFRLEDAGARVAEAPDAIVVHPEEHAGLLDPLRWARRYEMDARLEARHPRHFRERIEVHRLGPFRVRRPIVRAAQVYVLASIAATLAALMRANLAAWILLGVALLAWIPIWAKWHLDLRRLPVALIVPFVLVGALARGRARQRRSLSGRG